MSRSVVVYQPCYYPKLHYLARIEDADVFVLFDDVEFSRRSRQHRAEIRFASKRWLTIPVRHTGNDTLLTEALVDTSQRWASKHLGTLEHKYGPEANGFEKFYERADTNSDLRLIDITIPILIELLDRFGIDAEVYRSSRLEPDHPGNATRYLVDLVEQVDGDEYICGQRAYDNYLREGVFDRRGIDVTVQDWTPEWEDGNVCSLDVLFKADDPEKFVQ
jgi:hypothetical protein